MAFLTRQELLDSYADNSTGNITALTHRNMVQSLMIYGALSSQGYSTTVGTTEKKLEFDTFVFGYGMTPGAGGNTSPPVGGLPEGGTYDEFNIVEQGHYNLSLVIDADIAKTLYTFQMFADNVALGTPFIWDGKADGDRIVLNFTIPVHLVTNYGIIDVRARAVQNSATTFHHINWVLTQLGS